MRMGIGIVLVITILSLGLLGLGFILYDTKTYFKKLASGLKLSYTPDPVAIRGELRGQQIIITPADRAAYLEIIIIPPVPFPGNLAMVKRNEETNEQFVLRDGAFKTGDRWFDRSFLLEGDNEVEVVSRLSGSVRSGLLRLLSRASLEISGNKLCYFPQRLQISRLQVVLEELLDMSELLIRPEPARELLLQNFLEEEQLPVARHNLDLLTANFKPLPGEREQLLRGLDSPDWEINLVVLRHLKIVDADHFRAILQRTPVPHLDYALVWVWTLSGDKAPLILQNLYNHGKQPLRIAILAYLANHPQSELKCFLEEKLVGHKATALLLALLRALEACGDLKTAETLVAFLKGGEHPLSVKARAKQTLSVIKQRLDGRGEGWLSLAYSEEDEGFLSLTVEEAGALAVDEEE